MGNPPNPPVHDLGGRPLTDPIDQAAHPATFFDKRVDAMINLMRSKAGVFKVDEMRRTIEALSPHEYETFTYYQKWLAALRKLMVEKGVLSEAEIEARLVVVSQRLAAERRQSDGTPEAGGHR